MRCRGMAKIARKPAKKKPGTRTTARKRTTANRWSAHATKHSDVLDLESGVFTWKDPGRIAASLKRSAEARSRRKADPLPFGPVDADVLYQSRRQESARSPQERAAPGQGQAARGVPPRSRLANKQTSGITKTDRRALAFIRSFVIVYLRSWHVIPLTLAALILVTYQPKAGIRARSRTAV